MVESLRQILSIETHVVKNSELLSIRLASNTELLVAPSLDSGHYFPQEGKTFDVCPLSEQLLSPHFLKIINPESKEVFFVSVPEVDQFPSPVRIDRQVSLYEVMMILLKKWEEGGFHHRITSSIETTFDRVGKVQNKTILRNYYEDSSRK